MRAFYLRMTVQGPDSLPAWLIFSALYPFSLLYGLIVVLRRTLYAWGLLSRYRAKVPVISVGNLTVGGTGKTPVVDALVKELLGRGKAVAVVSRGYRGRFAGRWARVIGEGTDALQSAAEAGDEPFLLAMRNPAARVYVARERRFGVMAAEADGAEVIVLDDAFQHLAVARDLDIVLLDARRPFGNGALLPAGSMREPRQTLQLAGQVILTHAEDNDQARKLDHSSVQCKHRLAKDNDQTRNLDLSSVQCQHRLAEALVDLQGQTISWDQVKGRPCLAFAGIARAEDFFDDLRAAGCQLVATMPLDDHQDYDQDTLARIRATSANAEYLLTTEKDAVKLQDVTFAVPCLAVPLTVAFENFAELTERLDDLWGDRHA
ncbi:MAG: tetraacyldisaccharide 4'-kinase [Desulfuromonadales bacterium]